MEDQYNPDADLEKVTIRIKEIIHREKKKVQSQAAKLSMRFKSTTKWKILKYPLVIPESINLTNYQEQDSALANFPTEILLVIFAKAEEDEILKSSSLALSCKRLSQTALLAKSSMTHNFLELLGWQPSNLKWCNGCRYNRPFDCEYWHEKKAHLHAWSDLKVDAHQFSSAQARYKDHEIDIEIWIKGWCSTVSANTGRVDRGNKENQWCPPCRAQWNWEMFSAEAALLFDTEFLNLKKQELLLETDERKSLRRLGRKS